MNDKKQIEEIQVFEFKVIDKKTRKEADIGKIALKEDWAKSLMYCDMQGFAITEDKHLILLDECGKYEFCPSDRFAIVSENAVVLTREEKQEYENLAKLFIYDKPMMSRVYEFTKETKEQARKETAENIFSELYKKKIVSMDMRDNVEYLVFMKDILELAKQFEVEIKE